MIGWEAGMRIPGTIARQRWRAVTGACCVASLLAACAGTPIGLARGFAHGPNGEFVPGEASYDLPFGHLDVSFDAAQLVRGERRLTNFVPVSELDVRGLATRYRSQGVGAPLAASTEHVDPTKEY